MELEDFGKFFMVGFNGTSFNSELRDFIDAFRPSGVILFSRNIQSPLQTALLNRDVQLHSLQQQGGGIFIGVDQEGGRVRRLNAPFTVFPAALQLAMSNHPAAATAQYGNVTSRELGLVGFNMNFVPVLDVVRDSQSHLGAVIGDRSYGHEPSQVTELGRIVIQSMRAGGIIPCCKHFPGHGGTTVDSHYDLPMDNRDFKALEDGDLVPFIAAVAMNVEMVMTAHVLFPRLDSIFPATMSHAIIGGILRQHMGYDGVVITDDLDMGAVSKTYSADETALRAFQAGADLLMFCNSLEKAFSARTAIFQAVTDGTIPQERAEESAFRIDRLKDMYANSLTPCDESAVRDYFGSGIPVV